MGQVADSLLVGIPAAVAVIYVVILFLKSNEKRDDRLNQMQQGWSESLKMVVDAAHEVINRNTEAIIEIKTSVMEYTAQMQKEWSDSMTRVMVDAHKVIDRNTDALTEIKGTVLVCKYRTGECEKNHGKN